MKAVVITLTALVATTQTAQAQKYPCNPATWCHPKSILCKSSEMVEAIVSGEDLGNVDSTSRGVCTDAYRWLCNKAGYNCKRYEYTPVLAWERCRNIMNTNQGSRDSIYAGVYVEACREGEYTCQNGYCSQTPDGCSGRRGGVKYGPTRCPKDSCGADNVIQDICDMSTQPVESSFECVENPLAGVPACCPTPDAEECRYLTLEGGAEISLRQCGGECPDACAPTMSPTTPTKAPTVPKGQTASPTESPSTAPVKEYPPAGVVVKFEQSFEDRDCCCKISCDCFGDPHCTTFFGQQQTSKISTGEFDMFANLDISLHAILGPPMGIIEAIQVVVKEDPRTFFLSTTHCNNATHNWQDASTKAFVSDVPSNWDFNPSIDPNGVGGFADPSIYKIRDSKGQILFEVKCQPFLWGGDENVFTGKLERHTRIDVVVTAWRDKIVKEQTGEVCCPSQEQNEEWIIQTGATGYCVDSTQHPLPGGFKNDRRMLTSSGEVTPKFHDKKAVLTFSEEKTARLLAEGVTSLLPLNADEVTRGRSLLSAQEVCEEYLAKAGANAVPSIDTLEECIQNVIDFGMGSITTLIDMIDESGKNCISDPLDPRLPGPNGLKECEDGVELEVQLEGTSEWIPLQSFPSGFPYCDNALVFDFSRVEVSPGRNLGPKDSYRLKQCTPNLETCGICAPLLSVQNAGFSFLYQCEIYNAYKNFLKYGLYDGFKSGEFSCGFKYIGAEDPLQCLKDYLPSLFA